MFFDCCKYFSLSHLSSIDGAATLSITTLSITTLSITTLTMTTLIMATHRITTLSITTLRITTLIITTQHNDTQYNNKKWENQYDNTTSKFRYATCRLGECRGAPSVGTELSQKHKMPFLLNFFGSTNKLEHFQSHAPMA